MRGTVGVGDTIDVVSTPAVGGAVVPCNVVLSVDSTHLMPIGSDRFVGIAAGAAGLVARVPNAEVRSDLAVVDPPYAPRRYNVVDLTTEAGGSFGIAAVNNLDHVLGVRAAKTVLWRAGAFTTIDGCPNPLDLNNNDQILCWLDPGVGVWTNGAIKRIAELDTLSYGLAPDVVARLNDAGDVGGSWASGSRVFTWIAGRYASVPFNGNSLDDVFRFNNLGELFVKRHVDRYQNEVDVIQNGAIINRIGLGDAWNAAANNYGDVAGASQGHPGNARAFLQYGSNYWAFAFGIPYSVNIEEQVVGGLSVPTWGEEAEDADRSLHGPFYWDGILGLQLLKNAAVDRNWVITHAAQLTDFGTILGSGDNATLGYKSHALLLIPTARHQ